METRYNYGPGSYRTEQLASEAVSAGLPLPKSYGSGYSGPGSYATSIQLGFDPALTAGQKTTLDGVVAAHVPIGGRSKRALFDVRADLVALSVAQKNAVWTDLTSGAPPKWATDAGANAAALAAIQMFGASATLSAADVLEAKLRGVAMYCQDNPNYLVHPAFDATINIPGDQ